MRRLLSPPVWKEVKCVATHDPLNEVGGWGLDRQTVSKGLRRFVEQRLAGLHDEPRSGRRAPLTMPVSKP